MISKSKTKLNPTSSVLNGKGAVQIDIRSLKPNDVVKFVKKSDKNDIINAKVVKIGKDKEGKDRIYFINTDYPNVGLSNFIVDVLPKYYKVLKSK